jgi:cobyrinic acid a,c-diamide synthase
MVDLDSKIDCLIEDVEKTIDIEGLITLAKSVKSPIDVIIEKEEVQFQDIHIGIAYDEAFNFYYEDNLDLLKALGATLHFFSPIRDKVLPESLHLLYFGGGFPEVFAKELEANQEMKKLLLDKLQDGIPYLAECGGLMYLNHQLLDFQGNNYKMLGWLNGQCVMTKGLKRFGYKTLTFNQDSVLGSKGTQIKVHEFHHSETELMEEPLVYDLKKIRKGKLMTQYECGYMKGNGVAGYPHFHFYSNPIIIKNLLMAAQVYRDK